jgi:hypothetical protein
MHHPNKKHTGLCYALILFASMSLTCVRGIAFPTAGQGQEPLTVASKLPPIPGVTEPVAVGNGTAQVLNAYAEDYILTGDDVVYPDDPSDTFFKVVVACEGEVRPSPVAVRLVCQDQVYGTGNRWGWKTDETGNIVGIRYIFPVPRDLNFAECALYLTGEVSIKLGPFFE